MKPVTLYMSKVHALIEGDFASGVRFADNIQKLMDYIIVLPYFINAKDIEVRKADVALKLIKSCVDTINEEFTFNFMSNSVVGNITQVYLLTSNDAKSDKFKVTQELSKKNKLSDNMIIKGKKMAFKKFIVSLKDKLDNDINELCTELGVYKFFF